MPLGIFPEGLVTNNKYLLPFKRGAFCANLSIRPVVLKYQFDYVSSQTYVPKLLQFGFLKCCFFKTNDCTVTHLPIFVPNDYLYKTHADKGKEKWEIYAWAIRDIMMKAGGLKLY